MRFRTVARFARPTFVVVARPTFVRAALHVLAGFAVTGATRPAFAGSAATRPAIFGCERGSAEEESER